MNTKQEIIKINIKTDEFNVLFNDFSTFFAQLKSRYSSTITKKYPVVDVVKLNDPINIFSTASEKYIFERVQNIFHFLFLFSDRMKEIYFQKNTDSMLEPYMRFMIIEPEEWKSRRVFEMYFYYVELFFQICNFFKEKKLISEISRQPVINGLIIKKEGQLNSLYDREKYLEKFIMEEMTKIE